MTTLEITQWIQKYPQTDVIRAIWGSCFNNHADIAVWQLPQSRIVHLLADFSKQPNKARLKLHESTTGFAISPFINPSGKQTQLLEAGLYICFSQKYELLHNHVPNGFWERVRQQLDRKYDKSLPYYIESHAEISLEPVAKVSESEDKAVFIQMTQQALRYINSKYFDKVVLARSLHERLPTSFDLMSLFDKVSSIRSNAFISLVSTRENGTWLGASPEILVQTTQYHFSTCSLAGTQVYNAKQLLSDVSWNQKEIEEQAMVSRYIIEQFKLLSLCEFIETGPMTVKAGELLHLKTRYEVNMQALKRPEVATEMLQLLHPTAAVCGLPKEPAMHFISQYEPLQRKLYSGYLGPVNIDGETNLYVNLRCMQIQEKQLAFFAGCGITHNSDPEKEWLESTLKCNTLRDLLDV